MGKVVRLLWELNPPSTTAQAAWWPYKDMLPVPQLSDARSAGRARWWQEHVERQKKGSKRFNSKEWRLCFAHLGLINLGSVFFPAHSFSWHPSLSIFLLHAAGIVLLLFLFPSWLFFLAENPGEVGKLFWWVTRRWHNMKVSSGCRVQKGCQGTWAGARKIDGQIDRLHELGAER